MQLKSFKKSLFLKKHETYLLIILNIHNVIFKNIKKELVSYMSNKVLNIIMEKNFFKPLMNYMMLEGYYQNKQKYIL